MRASPSHTFHIVVHISGQKAAFGRVNVHGQDAGVVRPEQGRGQSLLVGVNGSRLVLVALVDGAEGHLAPVRVVALSLRVRFLRLPH